MDESAVHELEAAMADLGTLCVRLARYRTDAGAGLERTVRALGDRARAHHRAERLDADAARRLVEEARVCDRALRTALAEVRRSPGYQSACAAFAAGHHDALARLLPDVFAGLERAEPPAESFYSVAWLRRGRPRRPDDVAGEIARWALDGVPPEGDDTTPGADEALPAVVLQERPPDDEPVLLAFVTAALPVRPLRLVDSGEWLVHLPALPTAFAVLLAPDDENTGEALAELAPEYPRFRALLAAELDALGVTRRRP